MKSEPVESLPNFNIEEKSRNNPARIELPRSDDRPNLSFATMITMAIQNSPEQMATLNQIYAWIEDTFPFYAKTEKKAGWQNSVRHNLSIHK